MALATVVAVVASGAAVVLTAPTAFAASSPCTDGTTPALLDSVSCTTAGSYTLGVPAGTTDIDVELVGGGGGAGYPARQHVGGNAAQISGSLALPPGTSYLYVVVGASGAGDNNGTGYGGGGSGILALDADHDLIAKVAIAGAGGSGAYNGDGGNAGSAGTSDNAQTVSGPGMPGLGATGGAGGTGDYSPGSAGGNDNPAALTLAAGGAGGLLPGGARGGGGGGGYAGGGGGGGSTANILSRNVAGGGGGSSLASAYLTDALVTVKAGTGGIQLPGLVAGNGAVGSVTMTFNGLAVPGKPTGVSAVAGNGEAEVTFTAPASDGGPAVTSYTVTATPGDATKTCPASPCTITGLANGTAYTFTVHATNDNGDSPESDPTTAVTPVGAPGAPTNVSAQAGNGKAEISFTAPSNNGGSAVTSYTVTATPGGATKTCPASPCTITGLDNGTAYRFTVHATNANGDSFESARSKAVTPSAPPKNWYRDPLMPEQRQNLAPVPANPDRSKGPMRSTKALNRTYNGTLAVPARMVRGHQLSAGQGVQLTGLFRFDSAQLTSDGRQKLRVLARSLKQVRALTCEGYADYAGGTRRERVLSTKRAQAVCAVLKNSRHDLRTRTVGYGPRRPAAIGGTADQRGVNRRVDLLIQR